MLVLSRKTGEVVVIGDGPNRVVLKVIEIQNGKVRLGFTADKSVVIVREELVQAEPEGVKP